MNRKCVLVLNARAKTKIILGENLHDHGLGKKCIDKTPNS